MGRTLLVAKLDESVAVGDRNFGLSTNIWRNGLEEPAGCRLLRRFDLVDGVPTWTFDLDGIALVKRIWMERGRNATYVQYEIPAARADTGGALAARVSTGERLSEPATERHSGPLLLTCRLLVNDRDYHSLAHAGQRQFQIEAEGADLQVRAAGATVPTRVRCVAPAASQVEWDGQYLWYYGFHLAIEAARGFDALEDHLCAGTCRVLLEPGATATFVMQAEAGELPPVEGALERARQHAQARRADWSRQTGVDPLAAPVPVTQLVLAADQFVVARASPEEPDGYTVIAGYPWFTDWGRDTMISLPGLTLVTGRPQVARQILRTWARHVQDGLIPNRFPDAGDQPEYNTADATLWYLWAIDQYVRLTGDTETLAELFPVMAEVIAAYRRGTRHRIRVGDDGLVYAGEPGINLTWMDAKIGDRVITPRTGKAVELSALWYDGLCNLAQLAERLGRSGAEYEEMARVTRASFTRFWNPGRNCLFDVLDGPDGADGRLRPNQIFAVSLANSPLEPAQQKAVVDVCEHELLTWFGLRTLSPGDLGYRGRYAGGPVGRDEAYHQGTAWGWLLGPFVLAHWRVYGDACRARALLAPMFGQLWTAGVGSLSEIFDADEPHTPAGCCAQAWSVAEVLRAWQLTQVAGPAPT